MLVQRSWPVHRPILAQRRLTCQHRHLGPLLNGPLVPDHPILPLHHRLRNLDEDDGILAQPAIRLEEAERRRYFDQGYLVLPAFVRGEALARLHETTRPAEFSGKLKLTCQYHRR